MTEQALTGHHLIAGTWTEAENHFDSDGGLSVSQADQSHINVAVAAAEKAFLTYGWSDAADRAAFLRAIADEIELRADALTKTAMAETALPEARLHGERGRTTGQLRLFADVIEDDAWLDLRHDEALPERTPLPRPDLRLIQRPIGPVAVFGASNFPLAFSTAGGDTAAALAAGCPVVVKGHSAHPGTGEIIAQAVSAAIAKTGQPKGVFSLIQGKSHQIGAGLVQHPLIRAVGFTGSLAGGRALFDLCASRPEPIPFFGELGSINPVFLLPEALAGRCAEIAADWAGSLTMGVGQFCTNPGVAVMVKSPAADTFKQSVKDALAAIEAQTMLTPSIADAYRRGSAVVKANEGVDHLLTRNTDGNKASPNLFSCSAQNWLKSPALREEVFGPLGLIVVAEDTEEMQKVATGLDGQLTCTLHMDEGDTECAARLVPILERRAGRLLVNGFPTGVEVASAMVHGGPYPASTNFGATSVGTMAIRRFLRPVCYQNFPKGLLPIPV